MATDTEKRQEADSLLLQARAILENNTAPAEEKAKVPQMIADAKRLQAEATQLLEIKAAASALAGPPQEAARNTPGEKPKFRNFGHFLQAVQHVGDVRGPRSIHPALTALKSRDREENDGPMPADGKGNSWETKDLQEGVGATGGFLVPTEYRAELYALPGPNNQIRSRATVIPMRRRAIQMPVLDQTVTTAGSPHWFGGITATWTEEAGYKAAHEPAFRRIELVAHKLVCFTIASDELLDDSAIGLAAFFASPMGFAGAINWEEEYCFLRGTGVGQPLGIINAGATIVVPAQAAAAVSIVDIINMVSHIYGDNPVWHISRSVMPQLLQLNGPAANPSYVFIPNGRDGIPATLFGYPIIWSDKLPALGTTGSIVLADWKYYLIGDRQATTIDSTNQEYFRYDETSWRAVHRVDGQPWLSTWFTESDGTSDVSPFVVLGAKTT